MPTATFFENFQGRFPLLSVNLHSRKCRGRYFIYKNFKNSPCNQNPQRRRKYNSSNRGKLKKMRRGFMKEMSIYDPKGEENLAKELQERVKNPVFVCIGTEKVFADSLGPRVGSLLNAQMSKPYFVYGLCNQNITAENLVYCHDFIKRCILKVNLWWWTQPSALPSKSAKYKYRKGELFPAPLQTKICRQLATSA